MVRKLKLAKKGKKGKKRKKAKKRISIKFPRQILAPVKRFLIREQKKLLKRKKILSRQDPFIDPTRVIDNAALDTDAAEQTGHARVTAMKRELDRKLIQTKKALTRLRLGKYGICEKCSRMIDTDRLMVRPEATTCVKCEQKKER